MDSMNSKLDELSERFSKGLEGIAVSLARVEEGIEAVRMTVVNLDSSPVPAIFIIEQLLRALLPGAAAASAGIATTRQVIAARAAAAAREGLLGVVLVSGSLGTHRT